MERYVDKMSEDKKTLNEISVDGKAFRQDVCRWNDVHKMLVSEKKFDRMSVHETTINLRSVDEIARRQDVC